MYVMLIHGDIIPFALEAYSVQQQNFVGVNRVLPAR